LKHYLLRFNLSFIQLHLFNLFLHDLFRLFNNHLLRNSLILNLTQSTRSITILSLILN
jgi:hypothetical protein